MKIIIAYPPIDTAKGVPLLAQNRQFQFFKEPTYIYPVVPAQAATMLKAAGHEVIWLDGIAGNISYGRFLEILREEKPDLIAMETKTPVIKQHWKIIDDMRGLFPSCPSNCLSKGTVPVVVLFGDHVTALPEESFANSKVDFVLTGGDYDFLLLNLCNFLDKRYAISDTRYASLEPGIYYRDKGQVKNTGKFKLDHDLNNIPFIDRVLTKWQLYAYHNGNYKLTPGTYIMSGRDCWWGRCTFCSWPALYPEFRTRSPENCLDEIGGLIKGYAVREIMDDTGTFPAGDWLRKFCAGLLDRGYQREIYLDCNMRFGALSDEDLKLMKKANFRLVLFGLESANQNTLDRLKKGLRVEDIISGCRLARRAGLYPHITVMFGYPWESYQEALNTLRLGQWLLKKGYAYTMQATLVIPYPGTLLFEECKENGLLKTFDWDDYDMKQPVMRTGMADDALMKLIQGMYRVSFQPEFILRRIFSLKDAGDLRYSLRTARKVLGHVFDFKGSGDAQSREG